MSAELMALAAGRRGHFGTESGYHSELWFELDQMFERPERLQPFVRDLAQRLSSYCVEVVCGPESGGARLALAIATELGVPAARTERIVPAEGTPGLFPVKYTVPARERTALHGRRVAIVDDAISAGSAVRGTLADLRACGAQPVALGALFVSGDRAADFAREHALALVSITTVDFRMWKPDDCPHCRAGVPLEIVSDGPGKS